MPSRFTCLARSELLKFFKRVNRARALLEAAISLKATQLWLDTSRAQASSQQRFELTVFGATYPHAPQSLTYLWSRTWPVIPSSLPCGLENRYQEEHIMPEQHPTLMPADNPYALLIGHAS